MAEGTWLPCGLAVVHPWLCDRMGHLTTRHYLGMFDDAAYQLFASLGSVDGENEGWADIRHEIAYLDELHVGALVRIEGRVTVLGRTSITAEYRMVRRGDERRCATLLAKTVRFDLMARKSTLLPEPLRAHVAAAFGLARG